MPPLFKFHNGPLRGLLARLIRDVQTESEVIVKTYDGREFTMLRADLYTHAIKRSD